MVSFDGNLNFSAMWFDEELEDCSDELVLGDDKELMEELRTGIWKVLNRNKDISPGRGGTWYIYGGEVRPGAGPLTLTLLKTDDFCYSVWDI